MAIISSAAHLTLCECGKHGRVVTATGTVSFELCSKEAARKALQQFAETAEVVECEMGEALRQINTSSLEETDEAATLPARITAEVFNFVSERARPLCDAVAEQSKWVN